MIVLHRFVSAFNALLDTVYGLPELSFLDPCGCEGWTIRDLVGHLVIGAQDVLITLSTPTEAPANCDDASYWEVADARGPRVDEYSALTLRLAAAYRDPNLLKHHLDDVGRAAARLARRSDPTTRVETNGKVLTIDDYLSAYVFETTMHHLDLSAFVPGTPGPSPASLSSAADLFTRRSGIALPDSIPQDRALLVATGRLVPTVDEVEAFGPDAEALPVVFS